MRTYIFALRKSKTSFDFRSDTHEDKVRSYLNGVLDSSVETPQDWRRQSHNAMRPLSDEPASNCLNTRTEA